MSSVIRLVCPNLKCRKILSVPTHARGRTVRCRSCGMRVTVPGKKVANLPPMQDMDAPAPEQQPAVEEASAQLPETE